MTIKVCTIIFLQGINVRVKYLNYSLINDYVILTIFCQLQYFLSTIDLSATISMIVFLSSTIFMIRIRYFMID